MLELVSGERTRALTLLRVAYALTGVWPLALALVCDLRLWDWSRVPLALLTWPTDLDLGNSAGTRWVMVGPCLL